MLLDLGIKRETADMFWPLESSFPEVCDNGDNEQVDHPAWSLGALIHMMPNEIRDERFNVVYYLTINKDSITYSNRMEDEECEYECYGNLFDCCVAMIDMLKSSEYGL